MTTTRNCLRHVGVILALASLGLGSAQAANFSKSVYDAAKEEVKARTKADRDACTGRKANAMDVCLKTAEGREKIALAQLDYNYSGEQKDEMKLWQAKADARYDIAKEKCDDLTGKEKDVCVQAARSEHDKAKANMKLAKQTDEAVSDADKAHLDADYKLAAEKCRLLTGEKQDVCMASAKAHYQQKW
ncbi:MAG: hypothetical protein REI09_11260 [Candidatus Dactylopiibacterium sp.]|nr:hypothetical protein [Candidatus Dactylopiibacterium sp.]